jgi:hypothetical protein
MVRRPISARSVEEGTGREKRLLDPLRFFLFARRPFFKGHYGMGHYGIRRIAPFLNRQPTDFCEISA